MNPLYFGSRRRLLFGAYHPPTGRPVEPAGVVLCPPLALEYMRSYRALRQLALQLAESGFHVLRFDYHGTGDSGGDGSGETVDGWTKDVGMAMQELGDVSGVSRFHLVGVRFGATLASRAAGGPRTIDDLVLWDPTVDGHRYVEWLLREVGGTVRQRALDAPGEASSSNGAGAEIVGVDGFPMELGLLRGIGEPLDGFAGLPVRRVAVLSGSDEEVAPLFRSLEEAGVDHTRHTLPDEAQWEDPARQGSIVVAPQALREIVNTLTSNPSQP